MKTILFLILFVLLQTKSSSQNAKQTNLPDEQPLITISRVADKIVNSIDFNFQLTLCAPQRKFDFLESLDLSRIFPSGVPAVAYALTCFESGNDRQLGIDISYSGELLVWLNDTLVFSSMGEHKAIIASEERGLVLQEHFEVFLKKGYNKLLIKSATSGKEWNVFLQPGGAQIEVKTNTSPAIGLKGLPYISEEIAGISNWLVIGPFPNPIVNKAYTGITTAYPPEKEFLTGKLYEGIKGPVTWTIPKVEVFGDVLDAHPLWGSYSNYNYHTAGVAWAMMKLAEISGDSVYDRYAKNYTDFHIRTKPFVEYQVKELHAYNSANHFLVETPLLDFTLAPSLPYVARLLCQDNFENRKEYENRVVTMVDYAMNMQSRSKDGHFNRLTPVKYTTWTDDMFMGLPFLVLASQWTKDEALSKKLLNDAISQVFAFNNQVWDSEANLYRHAQYSDKSVKMPHWSRANGWAIWAVSEVLLAIPASHPAYKQLITHYRKHVDALINFQDASGFWNNVIDVPASRAETSGTAIFTMAIARGINHGWLEKSKYAPFALNGWKALNSVIEPDGTVHGICMGTMCSEDLQYYFDRPILENDSHGILGLIFAAIEMQEMLFHGKH